MKSVYYFAYGSNMNSRYLSSVRGVIPRQSTAAQIEHYQVRFTDYKIPFLPFQPFKWVEPAFAVLVQSAGEKAHGVMHELTHKDIKRIGDTEGSQYRWEELETVLPSGEKITCMALVGSNKLKQANPSRRYLNICLEGAVEYALPEEYLLELRNMEAVYYKGFSEATEMLMKSLAKVRSFQKRASFKRNQ